MDNSPLCGIPDCNTSDNSAVWLLEWTAMEDMFQPNLIARPLIPKFECLRHVQL
ncbi:uncharacterized protein DS421_13g415360 [Arachis hypogaea]|nr:uncharacterized protein DS421_13g415360 [Arachis hypogaea]